MNIVFSDKTLYMQAFKISIIWQGAVADQVDQNHRTSLLLAASHGGWRTVDVLLAHGADPTIRDKCAKNLLHVVLMSGGSLNDVLSLKQASSDALVRFFFLFIYF